MSYIKDAHFDAIVRGQRTPALAVAATIAPPAPTTVQVPSSRGDGTAYTVAIDGSTCTCKGHTYHGHCKHAGAGRRDHRRPAAGGVTTKAQPCG